MNEWLMIVGMALVTFTPRYGVMALLGRVDMPKPLFNALRFVPPAVLSAIILPEMVLSKTDSSLYLTPQNTYLVAGIVAALVAWRTKNLLLTIVIGMAALFVWRAVIGV